MAKSLRAKGKMADRRRKRESGFYAATEAARLERLSARLLGKNTSKGTDENHALGDLGAVEVDKGNGETVGVEDVEGDAMMHEGEIPDDHPMCFPSKWVCSLSGEEKVVRKISTSAPRDTRREQWRLSKGMTARPKGKGLNRQGKATGRSKAGRPKRRR